MKFLETKLKGSYIIVNEPISDNRGFFERIFCKEELKSIGLKKEIVQINRSFSIKKGTFRGLHFQNSPFTETKIVRCIKGSLLDIFVDLRYQSPTFLQHHMVKLSEYDNKSLYIPDGFAHGFQTLESNTEIMYFVTNFYHKEYESALNILDKNLNINLPITISEISEKDKKHPFINVNFTGF